MTKETVADHKRFSAEMVHQLVATAEPTGEARPPREVSNEDILNALLTMSEGIRSIVVETIAAETVASSAQAPTQAPPQPSALSPSGGEKSGLSLTAEEIRAIVAEGIAGPMSEVRQTVQLMNDFRDGSLPAMSDAIGALAQGVATQMAEIRQIAQEIKGMESASFRGLSKELSDMMFHIDSTKAEIASLRPEGSQDDQIVVATSELDAVVEATEAATSEILEQAEKIQAIVETLRKNKLPKRQADFSPYLDELEGISTQLLMSCGFQDLTGQRINKVVNTLLYLEQHISAMMTIWQIERGTGETALMANAPGDTRPDKELLNGPQLDGAGVSQGDIDALFD